MTPPKEAMYEEISYEYIPPWELNEPTLAYEFPTDEDIEDMDLEREIDREQRQY